MKFNYAHFPVGTICEVKIGDYEDTEAQIVEVSGVVSNGPDSWCIETTTKGTCTEFFACNISWVRRIIKRGSGPVNVLNRSAQYTKDYFADAMRNLHGLYFLKPKTSYVTYSPRGLLSSLLDRYTTPDTIVDGGKLFQMLEARGLMRTIPRDDDSPFKAFCVNKKKLHKALRQLVNKCLARKAVEQKAYDEALAKSFEEDWDDEYEPEAEDEEADPGKQETIFPVDDCCSSIQGPTEDDRDNPIHGGVFQNYCYEAVDEEQAKDESFSLKV